MQTGQSLPGNREENGLLALLAEPVTLHKPGLVAFHANLAITLRTDYFEQTAAVAACVESAFRGFRTIQHNRVMQTKACCAGQPPLKAGHQVAL